MDPDKPLRVAVLSSYVPRKCGIATFARDLSTAIAQSVHGCDQPDGQCVGIVALNDRQGDYTYGPEVGLSLDDHRLADFRNTAEILNNSRFDVVSVQHEYGLYGGDEGEYLFEMLDRLNKPVVATLHTVLSEPSAKRHEVLKRLCQRCERVVVMAERARHLLTETYEAPSERIHVIHHGVREMPFNDTEPFKKRFGLDGRPTILTFGLLSPNKGIETMLEALARVVRRHPNVAYIILGMTHPGIHRESGEQYRFGLERKALELGIQKNVVFHNRFVSDQDLGDYLQAADLYVTPYPNREQITSGTLAYALASGRAVVSTPYWYAQELLADGRGCLVEFGDMYGLADRVSDLLDDAPRRKAIRRAAHEFGRSMSWSTVARQYNQTFAEAVKAFQKADRPDQAYRPPMRLSLPPVRLDHLLTLTDETGVLQHAVGGIPNREHGYCTDDNTRALIVTAMMWSLFRDESILPLMRRYLSFIHFAMPANGGRFRNFMDYDRRWLEETPSDDCQGRALWSLGHLVSHAPDKSIRDIARDLFLAGIGQAESLAYPRGWGSSILGAHYYLREFPDDSAIRTLLSRLADKLDGVFANHATDDWPWLEDQVTYGNGRMPQALIIAGFSLERPALVERGLKVLRWLLDAQTFENGNLSIIGNAGWYQRDGQRARFDQQPIEPAALIGACKAAYRASQDKTWLIEMRRCFEWYLGRNDPGLSMVDFKTRGCYDGLKDGCVNQNQGAEALLSWLLSLLVMHEMQTDEAPEVG
ncbi:MAG: glycosyltransferase [Phycisphaerae bacterium]